MRPDSIEKDHLPRYSVIYEAIMRVTGGIYRGTNISCPPGIIRPAMDRMRESLFSILGNLDGLSFLDLFSGSGVVGIEAASRCAEPVHLVESDRGKKAVILKNISCVASDIHLYLRRAEAYIRKPARTAYDIVYADPPFPMKGKQGFTADISRSGIVAAGGLFIIHHPSEELWHEQEGAFICIDTRRYGRSILRFFRYAEGE